MEVDLIIPSDSSLDYYPENTNNDFACRFSRPLQLPSEGEHEIALVDMTMPRNVFIPAPTTGSLFCQLLIRTPTGDTPTQSSTVNRLTNNFPDRADFYSKFESAINTAQDALPTNAAGQPRNLRFNFPARAGTEFNVEFEMNSNNGADYHNEGFGLYVNQIVRDIIPDISAQHQWETPAGAPLPNKITFIQPDNRWIDFRLRGRTAAKRFLIKQGVLSWAESTFRDVMRPFCLEYNEDDPSAECLFDMDPARHPFQMDNDRVYSPPNTYRLGYVLHTQILPRAGQPDQEQTLFMTISRDALPAVRTVNTNQLNSTDLDLVNLTPYFTSSTTMEPLLGARVQTQGNPRHAALNSYVPPPPGPISFQTTFGWSTLEHRSQRETSTDPRDHVIHRFTFGDNSTESTARDIPENPTGFVLRGSWTHPNTVQSPIRAQNYLLRIQFEQGISGVKAFTANTLDRAQFFADLVTAVENAVASLPNNAGTSPRYAVRTHVYLDDDGVGEGIRFDVDWTLSTAVDTDGFEMENVEHMGLQVNERLKDRLPPPSRGNFFWKDVGEGWFALQQTNAGYDYAYNGDLTHAQTFDFRYAADTNFDENWIQVTLPEFVTEESAELRFASAPTQILHTGTGVHRGGSEQGVEGWK